MRNRIVKLNLYMEMWGLGVSVSACASSFFGMNMLTGLEDHPFAFFLAAFLIVLTSVLIVVGCILRFRAIIYSGKAQQFPILKNIFRFFLSKICLGCDCCVGVKCSMSEVEFLGLIIRVNVFLLSFKVAGKM